MKILLTTEILSEKTAASKARQDVQGILKREGYQTIQLPQKWNVSGIIKFWKHLKGISPKDSHVIVEYPCMNKKRLFIAHFIFRLKKIPFYAVIHDIVSLRENTNSARDMRVLNLFDGIVSHNRVMTEWLRNNGYSRKIINLDVFDYLLEKESTFAEPTLTASPKILYAGNLGYNKATYIYDKWFGDHSGFNLHLYGQYFEKERITNNRVNYKGVFSPGQPELDENYNFGLVWEGKSLDACTGELGEYMRYNNPHKFSLYLALGLPVIVWKDAAIASFVKEHNIGFTISGFDDLENLITHISDKQYNEYLKNVEGISDKIRKGYYLNKAIGQLTKS